MTLLKIYFLIIISIVIFSQSLQLIQANDDEFSEFDDIVPGETRSTSQSPNENSKQSKSNSDVNNINFNPVKDDLTEDKVDPIVTKPIKTIDGNSDQTSEKSDDANQKPKLKLVNSPNLWIYRWDNYYIELGFIFAFLLYFVNFLVGSNRNSAIIQEWYDVTYDVLTSNFCLIGGSPLMEVDKKTEPEESVREKLSIQETYKNRKGFVKMSESSYTLWCSGRVGMDGVLIHLDLLKRQDLFSMALNLVKPNQESIIMHYLMNNSEGYDNFVFCIANKIVATKLARDQADINVYCPKRKPLSQCGVDSDRLHVMSESSDITSYILDADTSEFLLKHEKAVNFIHITDQYTIDRREEETPALKLANCKRVAIFSFVIPPNPSEACEFVTFSLNLMDRLRKFRLNRDSKQKSEKMRQKITGIQQKTALAFAQQKAKETKDALRRQQKESMINEEDPAKQRMWERKEAKREQKRSKMRVKQLKVKSM